MNVSRRLLSKPVCLVFLIVGIVFGNGMMFLFGNNPADPLGTISLLCEDRKYLFWIWALFVVGGYYLNTLYAYRRYASAPAPCAFYASSPWRPPAGSGCR